MNDATNLPKIRPLLVAAGEGERIEVLGAPMVMKADPGRVAVFLGEHVVPPGYGVPPHIHADEDEVFYVLEGTLTAIGPDGTTAAGPGTTVVLPRGGVHGFRNDGAGPVRFLVIAAGGRQAVAMFRALDAAGRQGPPAPETVMGICAAHGVAFA